MNVSSVFDLMRILLVDDAVFLGHLQNAGLVRRVFRCSNRRCRRQCNLQRRESAVLGVVFRCPSCRVRYSVIKGSFFENSRLPIRTTIFLMWEWVCEIRARCAAMLTACTRKSVIQQYRFFRDICSWELLRRNDLFLFGEY